tara:strand:- start:4026 stop:4400 length:375 start_codon:yes stop_codon:yes gene_type:complete
MDFTAATKEKYNLRQSVFQSLFYAIAIITVLNDVPVTLAVLPMTYLEFLLQKGKDKAEKDDYTFTYDISTQQEIADFIQDYTKNVLFTLTTKQFLNVPVRVPGMRTFRQRSKPRKIRNCTKRKR